MEDCKTNTAIEYCKLSLFAFQMSLGSNTDLQNFITDDSTLNCYTKMWGIY